MKYREKILNIVEKVLNDCFIIHFLFYLLDDIKFKFLLTYYKNSLYQMNFGLILKYKHIYHHFE
jgi:hypothetical protein